MYEIQLPLGIESKGNDGKRIFLLKTVTERIKSALPVQVISITQQFAFGRVVGPLILPSMARDGERV